MLLYNLVVDGDSLTTEGMHSGRDIDDDDDVVLMLPSSQLAELDQAYKSGGQDAARQLLQNQSIEQVYQQCIFYMPFYQVILALSPGPILPALQCCMLRSSSLVDCRLGDNVIFFIFHPSISE